MTRNLDDADVAAGDVFLLSLPNMQEHQQHNFHLAPLSMNSNVTTGGVASDLEFFDDLVSEPVLVLGFDISHFNRSAQFIICASGVFFFSLLYGYLQELISVQLCNRKLGLFLATVQFVGYTVLAYVLRQWVYDRQERKRIKSGGGAYYSSLQSSSTSTPSASSSSTAAIQVPMILYLGLSLLRALDLGMTNLAMQYINYPAKTLLKSSRVVFTMLFGVILSKKQYRMTDYMIVLCMVAGLCVFMHADAHSSAIFAPMGVVMLTVSLVCDGAISNMSETIMSQFGVGQDEFIFKMYSIALVAISAAAAYKGDLREGFAWLAQPGTYDELSLPLSERTWSVPAKIGVLVLFSSMGFFGSSCSAAITKQFGALTMSITSVTRKATTLFLSFFLFNNVCTPEHVAGIIIFISALTAKSLRRRNDKRSVKKWNKSQKNSPFASSSRLVDSGDQHLLRQLELETNMKMLRENLSEESMKSPNYHNTAHIV
jgi:hypothetical protein